MRECTVGVVWWCRLHSTINVFGKAKATRKSELEEQCGVVAFAGLSKCVGIQIYVYVSVRVCLYLCVCVYMCVCVRVI